MCTREPTTSFDAVVAGERIATALGPSYCVLYQACPPGHRNPHSKYPLPVPDRRPFAAIQAAGKPAQPVIRPCCKQATGGCQRRLQMGEPAFWRWWKERPDARAVGQPRRHEPALWEAIVSVAVLMSAPSPPTPVDARAVRGGLASSACDQEPKAGCESPPGTVGSA